MLCLNRKWEMFPWQLALSFEFLLINFLLINSFMVLVLVT